MNRRQFILGSVSGSILVSGCLNFDGDGELPPTYPPDSHSEHRDEFHREVQDRGVEVLELEHRTEHDGESVNEVFIRHESGIETSVDAMAEVAMAFVERIQGGWNVDNLDGLSIDEESANVEWRVDREWAQSYIDGDITASEFGQRINDESTPIIEINN